MLKARSLMKWHIRDRTSHFFPSKWLQLCLVTLERLLLSINFKITKQSSLFLHTTLSKKERLWETHVELLELTQSDFSMKVQLFVYRMVYSESTNSMQLLRDMLLLLTLVTRNSHASSEASRRINLLSFHRSMKEILVWEIWIGQSSNTLARSSNKQLDSLSQSQKKANLDFLMQLKKCAKFYQEIAKQIATANILWRIVI